MTDENKTIVDAEMADLNLGEKKVKKVKKEKKEKKAPVDGETGEVDLDLKKKKKVKKEKTADLGDLDLDLTKKKKKKTKEKSEKSEKSEDIDALDLSGKKKKDKKVKKVETAGAVERKMEELDEAEMAVYGYSDLLDRVFDLMDENSVGKGAKGFGKRIVCPPPQMVRIGTKKSGYQNFGVTCECLKRSPKHVLQYVLAETGTSGNLDGDAKQIILRGRFKPSHMENVLREYIKEYVQCATCKSANTTLEKLDRLTFMSCNDCSSRRTVLAMTTGFQALVGKRKKQREKTGAGTSNAMKGM
jgi:translation initiation factor 2 subunit 2